MEKIIKWKEKVGYGGVEMSYSVIKNTKGLYDIIEKDSGVTIRLDYIDESKIRGICRKLNLGSGFVGYTPLFIAEKLFTGP